MHSIALFLALLGPYFELCCNTLLVPGEIVCFDYTLVPDPSCAWVTACGVGGGCRRGEPFEGTELDDFRCCEYADVSDGDGYAGCEDVDPILVDVPWCEDDTLAAVVTCGGGWTFDLDSESWSCPG